MVLTLLWIVPIGLLVVNALWRFISAISPGKPIGSDDESNALSLTIAAGEISGDNHA